MVFHPQIQISNIFHTRETRINLFLQHHNALNKSTSDKCNWESKIPSQIQNAPIKQR